MKKSDSVSRKFVESFDVSDYQVETESGYVDILASNKTVEYEVYEIRTESGLYLGCADTHILMTSDMAEVFAKDSLGTYLYTKNGPDKVVSVIKTDRVENMYDLSVDSENHTYFGNGILSHNTITTAAYFLWVVQFNSDKNIAILANKAAMAREILSRIQFAYENLPFWMQQGVVEWNKGSIKLDNNSKIFTAATTPNAIRGQSCSHVYCVSGDTLVTVKNKSKPVRIDSISTSITRDITEVLTTEGFKSFSGLRKTSTDRLLEIRFSDNSKIKVTFGHKLLLLNNKWIFAEKCKIGTRLVSQKNKSIKVVSIRIIEPEPVYDLISVQDTSSYYTNNVVSHNCDELAFVPNNIAEEFLTSVFPVLSSGKETKIFITSTPKGMNTFYKIWTEAEAGRNGFVPIRVVWTEHPERNQAWYDDQVKNLGPVKAAQEIDCVGPDTLVDVQRTSDGKLYTLKISCLYTLLDTSRYEILTPHGYCSFSGIVKKDKATLKISFSSGDNLVCTHDHKVLTDDGIWTTASDLKLHQKLSSKEIISITENGITEVYDPVNVDNMYHSYYSSGIVSHNCEFSGSSKTLVDGRKLASIPFFDPKFTSGCLKLYEVPIKNHSYICTVDTSRGQHLDYSAFIIFDITEMPYRVVGTFKDNTISLSTYPFMIMNAVKQYNDAYCLIEINDAGQEIANVLFYEFEYENVYFTLKENLTEGSGYPGVRTTKRLKSIGCSTMKELIEKDQLLIQSYDILQELAVYEQKGASYAAADTTINDDFCSCLFLFGWITKQAIFSDITNTNVRKLLAQKNELYIQENMTPFGEMCNGMEEFEEQDFILANRKGPHSNPLTNWLLGAS